jgi:hypothetical protein
VNPNGTILTWSMAEKDTKVLSHCISFKSYFQSVSNKLETDTHCYIYTTGVQRHDLVKSSHKWIPYLPTYDIGQTFFPNSSPENGRLPIITHRVKHVPHKQFPANLKLGKWSPVCRIILYSDNYCGCWCLQPAAHTGTKSTYKLILSYKSYEFHSLR